MTRPRKQYPKVETWESVSATANTLVFGSRGESYSHPHDDYGRVVDIAKAITPTEFPGLSPRDAEILRAIYQMIAVKLSRQRHAFECSFPPDRQRDNFVDNIGYEECLWGAFLRAWDNRPDSSE